MLANARSVKWYLILYTITRVQEVQKGANEWVPSGVPGQVSLGFCMGFCAGYFAKTVAKVREYVFWMISVLTLFFGWP